MTGENSITTDHDEIRQWAEERGGRPARVKGTDTLRIDFVEGKESSEENLEEISWEDFLRAFDENGLAFVYQTETADGKPSRFFEFADRAKAEETEALATEEVTEEEEEL